MSWKSMHWEKIPWSVAGREAWRTQVEEANKQDIPVRLMRVRQKDGKEVQYFEKFVKARDCDVKDCTSKASESFVSPSDDHYMEIALCSYHYHDFMYGKDPEVTLNFEENIHAKYYDN
jgi:hypothetical protein